MSLLSVDEALALVLAAAEEPTEPERDDLQCDRNHIAADAADPEPIAHGRLDERLQLAETPTLRVGHGRGTDVLK